MEVLTNTISESTSERYEKKFEEAKASWAKQFEQHQRSTSLMIEAELNSRDRYWRATVDELRAQVLMTTESLTHSTTVATQLCTALDSTQRRLMTFEQVCGMGVSFAEETLLNPHPRVNTHYQELVASRLSHARNAMSGAPPIVRVFPRVPPVVATPSVASASGTPRHGGQMPPAALSVPRPLTAMETSTGSSVSSAPPLG